ncbi:MAG: hypothetical protein RJB57_1377 [Actinomycetota bacterium]|jgi:hypothetical protein
MDIRKSLQNGYGTARNKAGEVVNNLSAKGGTTGRVVEAGMKGVNSVANVASRVSGAAVDRTTRFIGLERYRRELEAALDEAVRVIATQEARIARLEDELGKRVP